MFMLLLSSFMLIGMIVIPVISFLKNIKYLEKRNIRKDLMGIVFVTAIYFVIFGKYLFDGIYIICSCTNIYDLPTKTGYITNIDYEHKPNVPTRILFLNSEQYEIDKALLTKKQLDKQYDNNIKYRIRYTPITKTILSIKAF